MLTTKLLGFIKRSPMHRYVVGFVAIWVLGIFVAGSVWLAYSAIDQVEQYAERQRLEQITIAPASDYVKYTNNQIIVHDNYRVGEPLIFTTDRTATGEYDATYVDRIYCPESPRFLVERAYSEGSTIKGHIRTDWTFGDYKKGSRLDVHTIDRPYENCLIESTVTIDVEGVAKRFTVVGDKPFDVVE